MSAFNLVRATAVCPACQQDVCLPVQFKYGDTWQYIYAVAEHLRLGGNDVGPPGKPRVVVDGVAASPCPHCRNDREWDFCVFLEHDRITRVAPENGAYDFAKVQQTYIVLQE